MAENQGKADNAQDKQAVQARKSESANLSSCVQAAQPTGEDAFAAFSTSVQPADCAGRSDQSLGEQSSDSPHGSQAIDKQQTEKVKDKIHADIDCTQNALLQTMAETRDNCTRLAEKLDESQIFVEEMDEKLDKFESPMPGR